MTMTMMMMTVVPMSDGCEGNIECILTYNGNTTNIIINYTLITLSLIPLYFVPPMLLTSALAFVGVAGNPYAHALSLSLSLFL